MLQVNIKNLIDDVQCYQTVRELRWPDGVACPSCESQHLIKRGFDDTEPARQRYACHNCDRRFDDLTDTIYAGHHQPLRIWILCSYLMSLNLSNAHIAQELDLNKDAAHHMTTQLRHGIVSNSPSSTLSGEVEYDEVDIVAGHKGQPDEVANKGAGADDGDSKAHGDVARLKARNRRSLA
jgi:transposase-like protein